MWVRKEKAGSAPGHTWDNDGDVIEVDDELGAELLEIPDGGFTQVEPPAQADTPAETDQAAEGEPPAETDSPKQTASTKAASKRTPVKE